ncbi:maleylpyruvate isomerase family mycothiol-dependent enzyme [Nocardioides sp. zg-DK7169]|uniref:maleylpyruvate isomerase family mycothiol-dependent enzyme n=1 Tax=Nocardioides sp. zg-DK7169 TaxID=2736600 RepID=UPI001555C0A9|nr:maleylpyruvate isomerase family mycothiol-dependent enzyme [Nocardioides sp. zg-DK7169]
MSIPDLGVGAPSPAVIEHLATATRSLVRTVDALEEDDLRAPSLLPRWTRAHLVAHLTLNSEGLASVLRGVSLGAGVPMYRSPEARDTDIEELSGRDAAALRDRLLAATTGLSEAIAAMPAGAWAARAQRTPGSRATFAAGDVPLMRLREVALHHADLGTAFTRADWTPGVAEVLAESLAPRAAAPCTLHAHDIGRTWPAGGADSVSPGPTVRGTAADLAWWLSGRGGGAGLDTDSGELPRTGAW